MTNHCVLSTVYCMIVVPYISQKSVRFDAAVRHSLRFYVALTCGCGTSREPPPNVALELCVRFRDRQVLRRACVSGSWGDVDRAIPFFPFIRDQPFKVSTPVHKLCTCTVNIIVSMIELLPALVCTEKITKVME